MKKLLLGLGTLVAVVAPITTIVACGTTSNTGGAIETPTTPDNGNQATIESVFATEFEKEYTGKKYDASSAVATYLNTAQKENPEFYKDIPAIKAVLFWSDDAKVNAISDYVKYKEKYDELRKMILGESNVKEIATSEFGGLKGSFPLYLSKVTSIGNDAFFSSRLTSLNLPKVTSIGDNAFLGSWLNSLSLPLVTSIGNSAFISSLLNSLSLPKVTSISGWAFGSSALTSLSLPLVASIGDSAFSGSILTSLNLPKVTSIGDDCWDHSSVSVPINVDSSHPGFFAFPGNNDATKEEYDEYIKNNPIQSNDSLEESV